MARYAGSNPRVMAVLRAMEKPVSELPPVSRPSSGTDIPMLMTDPNTGEIYRRGGGQSVRQMQAMEEPVTQSKPSEVNIFRKAMQKLNALDAGIAERIANATFGENFSKVTDPNRSRTERKIRLAAGMIGGGVKKFDTLPQFVRNMTPPATQFMAEKASGFTRKAPVILPAVIGAQQVYQMTQQQEAETQGVQTSGTLMP